MTEIVIEKGIEIPASAAKRGSKYPFAKMEVGDSFFVKDAKAPSMSSAAAQHGKRAGMKFLVRAVEDGVRVWRAS